MKLIVEVFGQEGNLLGQESFSFGQRLVKEDGSLALPWEASEVGEDTRIQPSEARINSFDLTLPGGSGGRFKGNVQIRAQLFYILLTEHVSQRLKIEPPKPILITSVEKTISVNGGVDPKIVETRKKEGMNFDAPQPGELSYVAQPVGLGKPAIRHMHSRQLLGNSFRSFLSENLVRFSIARSMGAVLYFS